MTEQQATQPNTTTDPLGHLPPDAGPEQHVLTVRPSCWRGRPVSAIGFVLFSLAVPILIAIFGSPEWKIKWAAYTLLALAVINLCLFTFWWVTTSLSQSIKITNKRMIERRGLLSRSTDEVLIDHIRNVKVDQTITNRIFNVGKIGVSSSGQDEVEIVMDNLPNPNGLKNILDRYRDMDVEPHD